MFSKHFKVLKISGYTPAYHDTNARSPDLNNHATLLGNFSSPQKELKTLKFMRMENFSFLHLAWSHACKPIVVAVWKFRLWGMQREMKIFLASENFSERLFCVLCAMSLVRSEGSNEKIWQRTLFRYSTLRNFFIVSSGTLC